MAEEKPKRLYDVKETCSYLGISRTTLYRMMKDAEILPITIYGKLLFDKNDLDAFIENAKGKAKARK
jgi:excisionase family DNA binding protein